MNPAAKLVIAILAIIAVVTVATLCALAWKSGEGSVVKDIALLVLGSLSGVLAKVGYDAAHPAVGPVENATVNVTSEKPS